MTRDNSTGKDKEFYELGKKLFDLIPPFAQLVQPAIAQEPTSAEYAQGYAEGFNDACKPVQPAPQREWVGLTDEEATQLWENTDTADSWELIKRVEAKLKEKNERL